jgi:hypothetical protein
MDNLRDEIGSSEQKEEIPQQEIDVSTSDCQVSIEPTLGSSILVDNLPTDE